MMKKHNEGYTLVLVLVVMLVLTTVSIAIMSFSLRNLQNQQKSVDRMAAKYEAMGEIEKIVGSFSAEPTISHEKTDTEGILLSRWIYSICGQNLTCEVSDEGEFSIPITLSIESNSEEYKYTVNCTVNISGIIALSKDALSQVDGYTISDVKVEYTSYEIGGAAS